MKPVTIAGGGLAGLALGLALRQNRVPVTLWEAGHYPRHRVCGEFISGRGLGVLERLGLKEKLLAAGGREATTARFWLGDRALPSRMLPKGALCISRYAMDDLLAREFMEQGGELRQNARWLVESSKDGVVTATGRRPQPVEGGCRWLGLKMHALQLELSADLEMHCFPNGYIGMCRLSGGEVNICGLFRLPERRAPAAHRAADLLNGPTGSALRERMERASPEEGSFCSVAGLSFQRGDREDYGGCRVGDALTMIPPITGNGMSMAFESAWIAATPMAAYSRGVLNWEQACEAAKAASAKLFNSRLTWAAALQKMLFSPVAHSGLGWACLQAPAVWRLLFSRTR